MGSFSNAQWQNLENIGTKQFTCWSCNSFVASQQGYFSSSSSSTIFICPHCHAPHITDDLSRVYPNGIYSRPIKHLPGSIQKVYDEACVCFSAGAYTAAVMLLRKILMNLSVDEGAKEGDYFSNYVKYLCDNNIIHKKQHLQADKIKKLGNDANHKIEERTVEDAKQLLSLIELVLKNNYESADEFNINVGKKHGK